jgi:hypothetical protein
VAVLEVMALVEEVDALLLELVEVGALLPLRGRRLGLLRVRDGRGGTQQRRRGHQAHGEEPDSEGHRGAPVSS